MEAKKMLEKLGLDDKGVAELNSMRSKASTYMAFTFIAIVLGVVMILVGVGGLGSSNPYAAFAPGFLCIIGAFILGLVASNSKKAYGTRIKEVLVTKLFEEKFTDVNFEPEAGLDMSQLKAVGMQIGDRNYSNDVLKARYNNVNFMQADLLMQDESTDSDGNTTTTTIFRGRWMTFAFNKEFNNYLQIRPNSFMQKGFLGKIFGRKVSTEQATRITFENTEFNDQFACFTNDDHMSFYLLTPHMMEKILGLKNKYPTFFMFFVGNELHMAIDGLRDAYEIGMKEISEAFVNEIHEDMNVIIEVIEMLSIENDIFK